MTSTFPVYKPIPLLNLSFKQPFDSAWWDDRQIMGQIGLKKGQWRHKKHLRLNIMELLYN